MKNFLSHSRERLDNFVGKFSSKKNEQNGLESAASVGAGLGMGFNPLGVLNLTYWSAGTGNIKSEKITQTQTIIEQCNRRNGVKAHSVPGVQSISI